MALDVETGLQIRRPLTVAQAARAEADGGLPRRSGVYAWWSDLPSPLRGVPAAELPSCESGLLYVGLSPRNGNSAATLRSRVLDQHANGTVGSSTFRRVLASFLWEERGWHPQCTRAGKLTLPAEDNRELTDWIGTHLKVNWIVVEEPWRWESQAIQALGPPLNVRENAAHEFNATVRRMRSQFAAAATLKPT